MVITCHILTTQIFITVRKWTLVAGGTYIFRKADLKDLLVNFDISEIKLSQFDIVRTVDVITSKFSKYTLTNFKIFTNFNI